MSFKTFDERYEYLKLNGNVGEDTFGQARFVNQRLYHSPEWKRFKSNIILRDNGCDLACPGFEIYNRAIIHHINPLTIGDIIDCTPAVFDPNNVITVSLATHNAIHYGDIGQLKHEPIVRTEYDTCPWKKK